MFGLGVPELVVILVILALLSIPVWLWTRIVHKAGFSKDWGLVAVIPLLNLVMLWVFAYATWPNVDARSSRRETITQSGS